MSIPFKFTPSTGDAKLEISYEYPYRLVAGNGPIYEGDVQFQLCSSNDEICENIFKLDYQDKCGDLSAASSLFVEYDDSHVFGIDTAFG